MFETISAEVIASEIYMTRSGTNKTIMLLEGENDILVYKKLFNDVEFTSWHGKENVVGAIKILNTEKIINRYIAIVDSDFENIDGLIDMDNLIHTDYHDFELCIFNSDSFNRICNEYCSDKIKTFEKEKGPLLSYMVKCAIPISILRYINLKRDLRLCFRNVEFEKFTSKETLIISQKKLLMHVWTKTREHYSNMKQKAENVKETEYYDLIISSLISPDAMDKIFEENAGIKRERFNAIIKWT